MITTHNIFKGFFIFACSDFQFLKKSVSESLKFGLKWQFLYFKPIFFYNFISKYPHLYISKQYILHTFIIYFEREEGRERFYTILFVSHYFAYIQLSALSGILIWSGVFLHLLCDIYYFSLNCWN